MTIRLDYHGYDHPATACGTYKGAEVYLLEMASSMAIVKRGAKRASSANYNKAKGVVLHALTSAGPDLAAIEAIEWSGEAGERACDWALGQCREWLGYAATWVNQSYHAERVAAMKAYLANAGNAYVARCNAAKAEAIEPKAKPVTLTVTSNQLNLLRAAVSLRNDAAAESDDYTKAERRAWEQLLAKIEKAA